MIAVVAAALLAASAPDAWEWAESVHQRAWTAVRERLSPVEPGGVDAAWSADVVVDDGWGPAALVRIWRPRCEFPEVEFVGVDGDENVLGALHALHAADPAVDAERAIARLPLVGGCVSRCLGVRELVQRFEEIRISVLPESYLSLHAPGFTVTVRPTSREPRVYVVDEGENELASWSADLVKAARSCPAPVPRCW